MGERCAVVGAAGYTGRLVVAELLRRHVEVVAVGRNPDRLRTLPAEVERHVVDGADATTLTRLLRGCGAVVSCVGSFVDSGEAVVAAAVAAGIPYVDTAADVAFLQRLFDRHDGPARDGGVTVVPGMAFYSAPADLVAALATRTLGRPPDDVQVTYRLSGARPSNGTLRSTLRRVGRPCPVWRDGQLGSSQIGDDPHWFVFPAPHGPALVACWPGPEVVTVPRHTGASSVAVRLAMPRLAAALARRRHVVSLVSGAGRLVARRPGGPSDDERAAARFLIVVDVRRGTERVRGVVEGRDLYGLSAAACAEAAQRLANGDHPAGVLSPAEAVDPTEFLASLSSYQSWRIER
jgi:short subunit dehydrogenase-like uncharacterized protein